MGGAQDVGVVKSNNSQAHTVGGGGTDLFYVQLVAVEVSGCFDGVGVSWVGRCGLNWNWAGER